jgi:hypothetical protein
LDAKNRGIKNQQYPGENQQPVNGTFRDRVSFQNRLDGKKEEKGKRSHQKPNKLVGKNNFQVIPDHSEQNDEPVFYF